MFDEYVSLGFNCEIAFQLQRRLGREPAGFFNWRITEADALLSLLRSDFADLLRPEAIGPGENVAMLTDRTHGYQLHVPACMVAERAKMEHLASRFRDPIGRRCYILKPRPETGMTRGQVAALISLLDAIDPDFHLVVLQQEQRQTLLPDRVSEHVLDFFAPMHAADQGDEAGYDRLFDAFPLYAASYRPCRYMSAPSTITVAPPSS